MFDSNNLDTGSFSPNRVIQNYIIIYKYGLRRYTLIVLFKLSSSISTYMLIVYTDMSIFNDSKEDNTAVNLVNIAICRLSIYSNCRSS